MGIGSWVKRFFGFDVRDQSQPKEYSFEDHTLYDVGYEMGRYYPDGDGWTVDSMEIVLRDLYSDSKTISRSQIEDLDRLLEETSDDDLTQFEKRAAGEPYLQQEKVEQFRRAFFDCYTDKQITSSLSDLYRQIRDETFGLDAITRNETTDAYEYQCTIQSDSPTVGIEESGSVPEPTEFETTSVEMKKIGGKFDLVSEPIIDIMHEFITHEAKLLWENVAVSGEVDGFVNDEEMAECIYDSMNPITQQFGSPDTIVLNDEIDRSIDIHGHRVESDDTGVMNVPFVVCDSNAFALRVTQEPISIHNLSGFEQQYQYVMEWRGNYLVTNEDMISGPSERV